MKKDKHNIQVSYEQKLRLIIALMNSLTGAIFRFILFILNTANILIAMENVRINYD